MARSPGYATPVPGVGSAYFALGVQPDPVNGNAIPSPGPFNSLIVVQNTGSAATLIVRAGGYQGLATGAPNSGYVAGEYQPLGTAAIGDLPVTVHANGFTVVDLEQDVGRFTQADGSMWLDWSTATDILFFVIQRPYMP